MCTVNLETIKRVAIYQLETYHRHATDLFCYKCRLLLVCLASSCEAERSITALLRPGCEKGMTQTRLNSVAKWLVHQSRLDNLDILSIARDFADRTDIRGNMSVSSSSFSDERCMPFFDSALVVLILCITELDLCSVIIIG